MQTKKTKSLLAVMLSMSTVLPAGAAPIAAVESSHAAGLSGLSDDPGSYQIYPVPHKIQYAEDAAESAFTLDSTVELLCESDVDTWTVRYAEETLEEAGFEVSKVDELSGNAASVVIGTAGSGETADQMLGTSVYTADLMDKTDAYALSASAGASGKGEIVIVGKDTDAAYYGVSTLKMMLSSFEDGRMLEAEIEDYADGELRGFIEGFYGSFDYASRESQMRSIRDVKGNLFVFASKTDPYHGGEHWGDLYPAEELADITHLVEVGKETKVRYGWSVHIGKAGFFNGASPSGSAAQQALYQERLAKLEAKFDQLYAVGVRDFHVLNDDYNSGNYADVVTLLNTLNAFLKAKGDCHPIVYCPNAYNINWPGSGTEIPALKDLDDDIYLYWTGTAVNSPITQENIDWPYTRSGQYPVTWLNYPCSEHDKAGIYLGNLAHYVSNADGIVNQKGLLSNPVNYPEANKVAYFQLMSWIWNHDNFTSYMDEIWEDSFDYLEPEVADSYLTIARNLSNCPDSGRYPEGFPESEYLKERLDRLGEVVRQGGSIAENGDAHSVKAEMENILAAIVDFRANCTNADLIDELDSWLLSLQDAASAVLSGLQGLEALETGDLSAAWSSYAKASKANAAWSSHPTREFPEKAAKGGSKRIKPFADTVLSALNSRMMPVFQPDWNGFTPVLYSSYASSADNAAKMFDGDETTYASWNIVQKAGDYFGVDLGRVMPVHDVSIIQGQNDTHHDRFHESVLEYSADGSTWIPIGEEINEARIVRTGLDIQARYIRLRVTGFTEPSQPSKKDFWTRVREFSINSLDSAASVLGSHGGTLTETSNGLTLNAMSGSLAAGDSVGVKLSELSFVQSALSSNPDLVCEMSENGVVWNAVSALSAPYTARYIRLRNAADSAVSLENVSLILTWPEAMTPSVSTNISSIKEGAWSNLTDGDLSTNVWTSINQADGQFIEVDFKQTVPFRSLSLYMSEQRPRLYHGIIRVSADGQNWRDAIVVDASNDTTFIEGNKRVARTAGDGQPVRHVRIDVTDSAKEEPTEHSAYLNLFELELNGGLAEVSKPSLFESSQQAEFGKAFDGSLSTYFTLHPQGDSSTICKVTDQSDALNLTVLQDPDALCLADVSVQTLSGWQPLGVLDQACTRFDLPEEDILSIRFDWKAGQPDPVIYEVILSGNAQKDPARMIASLTAPAPLSVPFGTLASALDLPETVRVTLQDGSVRDAAVCWNTETYNGQISGVYEITGRLNADDLLNADAFVPSLAITVEPSEEESVNLALNQPVESSGLEVSDGRWTADKAVDGIADTEDSRWSSGKMKQGNAPDQQQTPQWLVIDLGDEKENWVESLRLSFYKKVYPTSYQVQFSEDGSTWIDSGLSLGLAPDGPLNPVDEVSLPAPVKTRYVRLLFNELNYAAAGNSLSLREAEIFGRRKAVQPARQADKTLLEFAVSYAQSAMAEDAYAHVHPVIKAKLEAALADAQAVLADETASQEGVDACWRTLSDAVHLLGFTADKSALEETVSQALELLENLDQYTGDQEEFRNALAAAQAVLENPNALDDSIAAAKARLEAAMAALQPKEENFDTALLEMLAGVCRSLDLSKYVPDGQEAFTAALQQAESVLAGPESQAQIDAAAHTLHTAYLNLRLIADESLLADLRTFAADFAAADPAAYTADAWQRIEKTGRKVQAALEEHDAGRKLIDEQTALELLEETQSAAELLSSPDKPAASAQTARPNSVKTSASMLAGWGLAAAGSFAALLAGRRKKKK